MKTHYFRSAAGGFVRLARLSLLGMAIATSAQAASITVDGSLTSSGSDNSCTYSQIRQSSGGNWSVLCGTGSKTITFSPKVCGSVCNSYSTFSQAAGGNWVVAGCVPASLGPNVALGTLPATVAEGTPLALSATADACTGTIAKVEFFANGVMIPGGSIPVAPFAMSWTPAAGNHAIEARATEGSLVTVSQTANVYVNAIPTVQITSPVEGSTLIAPITLQASASDVAGSIARVEYYEGTTLIGFSTTGPAYQVTWSNPACSNCTITAKAIDNLGTEGTSVPVTFIANKPQRMTLNVVGTYPYIAPASLSFTLFLTGSGQAFDAITLYKGTTSVGTMTFNTDHWEATVSNLPQGTHSFTARATTTGGATVAESNLSVVTVDPTNVVTAPVNMCMAEQISGIAAGAITGAPSVSDVGAASYSVPISAPPGIAGLAPVISIAYNSQGGNGTLGVGFSIQGFSVIQRCAQTYFLDAARKPVNYSTASPDQLCLDGQRLVPLPGGSRNGTTEYRTERESYSKIQSFGSSGWRGPASFKIQTKTGQVLYYGLRASGGEDAVLKYYPEDLSFETARIWALQRVEDRSGNAMEFNYSKSDSIGYQRPESITYAYTSPGTYANRLAFSYGARTDTLEGFDSGAQAGREDSRLTGITTYADGVAAKQYQFGYSDANGSYSAATFRSLLRSITECSGDGQLCMRPTTFAWTDAQANVRNFMGAGSGNWNGQPATGRRDGTIAVDLNGDGRTDFISADEDATTAPNNSRFNVCLSLGSGFDCTTWQADSRASGGGLDDVWRIADFDGDGKADLVYLYDIGGGGGRGFKLYRSTGTGFVHASTTLAVSWDPTTPYTVGDFDGDGRADLALYTGNGTWRFCRWNGSTFSCDSSTVQVGDLSDLWGSVNAERDYQIGDFNGDGKADFAYHRNNSADWQVCQSISSAAGSFTFQCHVGLIAAINENAYKTHVADLNGDGMSDLLAPNYSAGAGKWNVCLSRGDRTFNCTNWTGPTASELSKTVLGDFNGDGRTDVAWYENTSPVGWRVCLSTGTGFEANCATTQWGTSTVMAPGTNFDDTRAGDFNGDGKTDIAIAAANAQWKIGLGGGTKPVDVVEKIYNGIGTRTDFAYRSLSDAAAGALTYIKDDTAVFPVVDVQSPLYVVSQAFHGTSTDSQSLSIVTYTYKGLKGHAQGGGMGGFASRAMKDTTADLCVQTVASMDWPNRVVGLPANITRKRLSSPVTGVCTGGVKVAITSNTWATRRSNTFGAGTGAWSPPSPGDKPIYEMYVASTLEERWDTDSDVTPTPFPTALTTTNSIDILGNTTSVTTDSGGGFSKTTVSTYLNNKTDWIIGRLTQSTITSTIPAREAPVNNNPVRVSAFEYDSAGRLSAEIIEPGRESAIAHLNQYLKTVYTYDAYGNRQVTRIQDRALLQNANVIRETTTAYCPDGNWAHQCTPDGRFPTYIVNGAGHVEIRTYDARFGAMLTSKGPNELTTTSQVDKIGRKFCETRPDQSRTGWSWSEGAGDYGTVVSTYDSTYAKFTAGPNPQPLPKSQQYFDRVGREVSARTRSFNDTWSTVTTVYDGRGRKTKVTKPYVSSDGSLTYLPSAVDQVFVYDVIDRVISQTGPGSFTSTRSYAGLVSSQTVMGQSGPQTTSRTANSRGETIKIVDALGAHLNLEYDHFGNLERKWVTNVPAGVGTEATAEFNVRGHKTKTTDLDQGIWTYQYNSVGEVTRQTDALLQQTDFQYDSIGRMVRRDAAGFVSEWQFDSCGPKSIGKLCMATSTWATNEYSYDSLSRQVRNKLSLFNGKTMQKSIAYDGLSRVRQVVFPFTNLTLNYVYNEQGYLETISEPGQGTAHWHASSRYVDGKIQSHFVRGQGISRTYDPAGRPLTIQMAGVQNATYAFDALGNLTSRLDSLTGLNEVFGYDALNRLVSSTREGVTRTYGYSAVGNLTSKDGVTYTYTPNTHRLASYPGNAITYDANGDYDHDDNYKFAIAQRLPNGKPLVFVSAGGAFDKIHDLYYDAADQRVMQWRYGGGEEDEYYRAIHYLSDGVTPFFEEEIGFSAPGEPTPILWKHYINTPEGVVGMVTIANDAVNTRNDVIFVRDHLGSIVGTIASQGGVESVGFDAWGSHRNADGSTNPDAIAARTDRGFTGHESFEDASGVINMNGRFYAPWLGRMMEPDPVVQDPFNMQSYNRYAYVMNNPLGLTDPTGLSWWTDNGRPVFRVIVAIVASVVSYGAASQWVAAGAYGLTGTSATACYVSVAAQAAATSSGIAGLSIATVGAAVGGAAAGFAAGGIMGGTLQSAVTGAVAGGLSAGVGAYFGDTYSASRVLAEGVTNGVSTRLRGGSFQDGLRTGLLFSGATYIAASARQAMFTFANQVPFNIGTSPGAFGVPGKLGGEIFNADVYKARFNVAFDLNDANLESNLLTYLEEVKGGPFGGLQGGPGKLFNFNYSPGDLRDFVVESFAGVHDTLNSPFFYNTSGTLNGTSHNFMGGAKYSLKWFLGESISALNVAIASPIVGAAITPAYLRPFVSRP